MQYERSELGADTPCEYRAPVVRAFHGAVLRAFHGMRQTQKDTPVWLPTDRFPLQRFPEFQPIMKWANDSSDRFVICENRKIYLRPVNYRLMGVDPEYHEGEWLSLSLVLIFCSGCPE